MGCHLILSLAKAMCLASLLVVALCSTFSSSFPRDKTTMVSNSLCFTELTRGVILFFRTQYHHQRRLFFLCRPAVGY